MADNNDNNDPPRLAAGGKSPICGRRVRNCRKCSYHFSAADYELWNCPECGEDRKCTQPGTGAGGACKRFHGGGAKVGIASPNFKHGGRSKHKLFARLPARFQPIIEEIGDDVLDLTDLAVVLKARFYDVVSRTHQGESQELIKLALKRCEEMDAAQVEITRLGKELSAARAAGDTPRADAAQAGLEKNSLIWNTAFDDVKKTLRQDLQDWQAWDSAVHLAEKTTRVVESQRKGMVEAKLVLSIDRVERIYTAMILAANEIVTDDNQIEKLQERFKLIALQGLGTAAAEIEDGTAYEA